MQFAPEPVSYTDSDPELPENIREAIAAALAEGIVSSDLPIRVVVEDDDSLYVTNSSPKTLPDRYTNTETSSATEAENVSTHLEAHWGF